MLEQMYSAQWLEQKPRYGFLLGLGFAIFGIFSAKLIFGANPGLMSVAFTSMLLMPYLNKLISLTESLEIRENKFSLLQMFRDHKDLFKIYIYIFLGIMFAYAFFTLVWVKEFSLSVFSPQLRVAGFAGSAIANPLFLDFMNILLNNLKVLLVCFLLSFFYGAGSILFLAWNASVWGSVFGFVARESSSIVQQNPFLGFVTMMIPVMPHLITEAISYFSAAIVGGVVSKAVVKEKWMSDKFKNVLTDSIIFLVLGFILTIAAAYLEVFIFPRIRGGI